MNLHVPENEEQAERHRRFAIEFHAAALNIMDADDIDPALMKAMIESYVQMATELEASVIEYERRKADEASNR